MANSSVRTQKNQTLSKIRFLEDQLIALDHYLPETYEYLMRELDIQKQMLAELEVKEYYIHIETNEVPTGSTSS
jgi:hypothetical protein